MLAPELERAALDGSLFTKNPLTMQPIPPAKPTGDVSEGLFSTVYVPPPDLRIVSVPDLTTYVAARGMAVVMGEPEQEAATLTKKETVGQRRARYLEWFNEEARTSERGALQRVYEREAKQNPKADRANIGKDIKKARGDANSRKQSGAMFGQLVTVKNGKRQN